MDRIEASLNLGPYCPHLARDGVCEADPDRPRPCEGVRVRGECDQGLTHTGRVRGSWNGGYVYQARPREVYGMAALEAEVLAVLNRRVRLVTVGQYHHWNRALRAALGQSDVPTRAGLEYREGKVADLEADALRALADPTAKATDREAAVAAHAAAWEALEDYRDELAAYISEAKARDRRKAGAARRAMRRKAQSQGEPTQGRPLTVGPGPMVPDPRPVTVTVTATDRPAPLGPFQGPPAPRHSEARLGKTGADRLVSGADRQLPVPPGPSCLTVARTAWGQLSDGRVLVAPLTVGGEPVGPCVALVP
jgi:hypothetical protein